MAGLGALGFVVHGWMAEVRRVSQDKAVCTFQLSAAMAQFFLQNPHRVFANYDDLVGPQGFIKSTRSVGGEDYHELFPVRADFEELAVTMSDGRRLIVLCSPGGEGILAYVRQTPGGKLIGYGSNPAAAVKTYERWRAEQQRREGIVRTAPPHGGRFETTWRGGVPDGPFRAYYPEGKLWAEANYVRGGIVGRHVVYDHAGKIIFETNFPAARHALTK